MYNSPFLNNNDENVGQHVSQEYSAPVYHEMQPPTFAPIRQPTFDNNRCKLAF
jgi:hypothetical protein